ncbi:hypothetical protein BWI17_07720 [Betaproteobacteria bacterium GR16-43]|nr:hypothetical protein BWI17_07720 [Betaproteobacteria bacterium GR16-43]
MNLSRRLLAVALATAAIQLPLVARAEHTHQGLWWASPAASESGWGLNITHQGNTLFATWFTYDTDGSPMWLVMSNGMREQAYEDGGYYGMGMYYYTNTFTGALYRTTGPAFGTAFNPAAVTLTPVGMATFIFDDPSAPIFSYSVNGVMGSKTLTRQVYANRVPECDSASSAGTPSYQDLWWRSPAGSESGWGMNITHQADTLFATWFTYGADGKGMWYVMTAPLGSNGSYSGALYKTRGPAFSASPWRPTDVSVTPVGTGSLTFSDLSNGVFAFTVDGVSQSKTITRQVYSSPVSSCRFQ